MIDLTDLPAAPRVQQGLTDLDRGRWTREALWLALATTRLRNLGLPIPQDLKPPEEPELALYAKLRDSDDPYYQYNAWLAELDSFLSALEGRVHRGP